MIRKFLFSLMALILGVGLNAISAEKNGAIQKVIAEETAAQDLADAHSNDSDSNGVKDGANDKNGENDGNVDQEESKVKPSGRIDKKEEEKRKFRKSRLTNDESEMKADKRDIFLSLYGTKVVDLDFAPEAGEPSIANPKVVAVTKVKLDEKRQIVFTPLMGGKTTVLLRDDNGTVRLIFNVVVSNTSLEKLRAELRVLFKEIEGVEIKIMGDKIVVDGQVLVPADYGRIFDIVNKDPTYAPVVLNLVTISPISMQILAKKIEEDIKVFADKVTTRVVNGQILLEGTVPNAEYARRASRIAQIYIPDTNPPGPLDDPDMGSRKGPIKELVQNLLQIDPPAPKKQDKLLRVTLHFVELSKDYNKLFGFKWQPGFTSDPQIRVGVGSADNGGSGASGGTSFTATISSLFPKLQSAQNAGFARIVKTANMIVRSGSPGKMDDQYKIPYVVLGATGQPIVRDADVGLSMGITPTILGESEEIQLDLNIKNVNMTGKDASGIFTSTHAINTKIYVKSSESAAIAGLENTDVATNFNRDDPRSGSFNSPTTSPLFTMERSKNYTKRKGQFVIFVTPQIIQDASQGTDDLKRNFRLKVN